MEIGVKEGEFSEQHISDMAKRGYEQGNAEFNVDPKNCALLVIDMQDEFVKPHWTHIGFRRQPDKFPL